MFDSACDDLCAEDNDVYVPFAVWPLTESPWPSSLRDLVLVECVSFMHVC